MRRLKLVFRAIAYVASIGLVGCTMIGGWIPGTIYSNDGTVLSFSIQKEFHTGGMKAFNQKTGEAFTGSYVGVLPSAQASSFGVANVGGGVPSGESFTTVRSNMANARGFLHGDKGTMLTCSMQIQAGLNPHGIGTCTDNHDEHYDLQF
ncbi:MAG: hypothetical protein B7X01_00025 [Acidiphilium sp. 21-62-4]|jgi:hypothetical protein|uniref:hypothetical protein n=1 Tax=Acidiphilium sp. C61 TaxID=1671485 RepID=UPI000BC9BBB5|nr:hypothetical protein [Acidiphilium sp. C61]OYV63753.1 MAG: hypothetical protein B7X01_00025 [Acidiphilium sp. 21-62-4]